MQRTTLKASVNKHFTDKQLSDSQMAELMAMQHSVVADKPASSMHRSRAWWWGASIAASLLLVFAVLSQQLQQQQQRQLLFAIAEEVSRNHIKLKPLEVNTDSLKQLSGYFTELEFSLVKSNIFNGADQSLLGGRYCSIQGSTAAQLRYQSSLGKVTTLYKAAYDESKFQLLPNVEEGGEPYEVYYRGLFVRMWVEKGLVMVSVKEPATSS